MFTIDSGGVPLPLPAGSVPSHEVQMITQVQTVRDAFEAESDLRMDEGNLVLEKVALAQFLKVAKVGIAGYFTSTLQV